MVDSQPLVSFYVPSQELVDSVPAAMSGYWAWFVDVARTRPVILAAGSPCIWSGPYDWTVQSFIQLATRGFPCRLTPSWPQEGIVLAHSDFLRADSKPSSRLFVVELKPDRHLHCAYANFVVAQNRHDHLLAARRPFAPKGLVVPFWPQPGLVPRDTGRGDRFENACFMGNAHEFIEDVGSLERALRGLGLAWQMPPVERWYDYSEADVIIAVRRNSSTMVDRKPSSRLTNAWLAGVPAVLSPDSAFEDMRRSELDYLRATDIGDVVDAVKVLIADPQRRSAMARNGLQRASEFNAEMITGFWVKAIESQIIPEYVRWRKSSRLKRTAFFFVRGYGGFDGPTVLQRLTAKAKMMAKRLSPSVQRHRPSV